MGRSWFASLKPLSKEACVGSRLERDADVVLFYLARWCQKQTGELEPGLDTFEEQELCDVAGKIARNVATDGDRVDRLVAGDSDAWTQLRRILVASARPRAGAMAGEYADEAVQRIAEVVLTGVPPCEAAGRAGKDLYGPANEYIFSSPFPFWARSIVIHLVVDDQRRAQRARTSQGGAAAQALGLNRTVLEEARDALPSLLDAIRGLPRIQRAVMVASLMRAGLHDLVHARLHELAPDLFPETEQGRTTSDEDIAERLGTTRRLVAANRSAARRKLARRDRRWELLLDVLLPHRSTRPVAAAAEPDGVRD